MSVHYKKQNKHLWQNECHWCGIVVTRNKGKNGRCDDSHRTIDHIKSKCECCSQEEYKAPGNKVIACYGCNQKRNGEFVKCNPLPVKNWSGKGYVKRMIVTTATMINGSKVVVSISPELSEAWK